MEGFLEEVTFEQLIQGREQKWDTGEIIIADNISRPVLSVRQCSKGFTWILH